MGIRISKDHLHPSVIESITSLIGDLDQLETTAKGNVVEAINELLANGGNKEELEALIAEIADGKELIANAVGEPLTAEESFDEMSNDINSLLSTFKTNMMNNGITVESGDKFKALIDKIATLADNEGKGMQFVSGSIPYADLSMTESGTNRSVSVSINWDLGFTPTLFLIKPNTTTVPEAVGSHEKYHYYIMYDNFGEEVSAIMYTKDSSGDIVYSKLTLGGSNYINENGFSFDILTNISWYNQTPITTDHTWYAIGVGEQQEDTTLRDSLASILQEEGVNVTEEDNIASLITKVDEEFNRQVVPQGTATANDVISGKTFINSTGQLVTGSITSHGTNTECVSVNGTTQSGMLYVRIPQGAYLKNSSSGYPAINVADSNFVASNIVSGKTIFGLTGTGSSSGNIASGTFNLGSMTSTTARTISYSPGFKPSKLLVTIRNDNGDFISTIGSTYFECIHVTSDYPFRFYDNYYETFYYVEIGNVTSSSFSIKAYIPGSGSYTSTATWYAIP